MRVRKIILFAGLLLAPCFGLFAKDYKVSTEAEFSAATEKAIAGDQIIIMNGEYKPWQQVINTNGQSGKPIIVRAETSGKVIFTGEVSKPIFLLTGSYTELMGINFSGCTQNKNGGGSGVLVELKSTRYCRVNDCSFSKTGR